MQQELNTGHQVCTETRETQSINQSFQVKLALQYLNVNIINQRYLMIDNEDNQLPKIKPLSLSRLAEQLKL